MAKGRNNMPNNSLHHTSAQLELEKASSQAKDNRIKSLEEIIIELEHDPNDPKGVQALMKKKVLASYCNRCSYFMIDSGKCQICHLFMLQRFHISKESPFLKDHTILKSFSIKERPNSLILASPGLNFMF